MTHALIKMLASYLLGSLVGSLLIGRLRGVDIRELGSGNAGGTNALRTQGRLFAFWVLLIDVSKGFAAARLIAPLDFSDAAFLTSAPQIRDWLPAACAGAVIVGHVYPLFFGFRGGKGMATLVGALLGIHATLLVPVLLTWLAVAVISGFVGLASMMAGIALPLYVAWHGDEPRMPLLTLGCFVAAFFLFTHRANIGRMLAGAEPRARRLWLFGARRAS